MELWSDTLAVANVGFGLLVGLLQLICFLKLKGHPWRPVKLLYALIGFYWAGLYTWVVLTPVASQDPVAFGRILVRPAFTITLAMMAVGVIVRIKAGKYE